MDHALFAKLARRAAAAWAPVLCVCGSLGLCGWTLGQERRLQPYDGIQAGVDAYRLAEERRQADLRDQVQTSDYLQTGAYARGATVYYYPGYYPPGYWSSGREAAYAAPGSAGGGFFEPWPFVPGDLWGFGNSVRPVRQPVGQRQVQTGPNRWESHPVYDPPLPRHPVLPPVASPLLNNTPFAAPPEAAPPPAAAPPIPLAPSPERREF